MGVLRGVGLEGGCWGWHLGGIVYLVQEEDMDMNGGNED